MLGLRDACVLGKQNLGSNIQQLGRSIVYLGEDTGPRQVCGQEPPRAEPRPDRTRVMPDPMHPALVLVYHVLREPDRLENAATRQHHGDGQPQGSLVTPRQGAIPGAQMSTVFPARCFFNFESDRDCK